jgi:hypothetical protein
VRFELVGGSLPPASFRLLYAIDGGFGLRFQVGSAGTMMGSKVKKTACAAGIRNP